MDDAAVLFLLLFLPFFFSRAQVHVFVKSSSSSCRVL